MTNFTKLGLITLLLFFGSLTGCKQSNPLDIQTVTGIVSFQGKPLSHGTVMFHATDGQRSAMGELNEQGKYSLMTVGSNEPGAMPGNYKIAIVHMVNRNEGKTVPRPGGPDPETGEKTMALQPKLENTLPKKWGSPETSDLTALVKKGNNTFDFSIE